ncbi:methyltransferase [Gordonia phage GMA2]|uniref:Putative methyltransferase n=1 Tax=Gordonia phage GMA2 TaxID=1647283 RepID=A0A0K0N6K5_9CAUD|nr:methyltransferase [Gordonia phage GMA2]AKJ72559.1 putative methyltransferase [Gordonia phage GMA2]
MSKDYSLGPALHDLSDSVDDQYLSALRFALKHLQSGIALEFGVGSGRSLREIAQRTQVIGFDVFTGLPEFWRPGFPQGTFACEPPEVDNATTIPGLFEDTLSHFDLESIDFINLLHVDCDLYSSTKTVLEHAGPYLKTGAIVVFDEWHGYPGADGDHEQLAWTEYVQDTEMSWEVLGHGPEQWIIRITHGRQSNA